MTVAELVVVPGKARQSDQGIPSKYTHFTPRSVTPSPLPGNELHKVVIERDAGFGIEDRRVGIADKVRGDNLGDRISKVSVGCRARTSRS